MSNYHAKYALHYAEGKALRKACSRSLQATTRLSTPRDIVAMLEHTSLGRIQKLIPLRYSRMQVSPFTFFRGFAMMQAADLAANSCSGLKFQICGDAHLMNYGLFASPERQLIFDINDCDETHHGPWEWDLKRLAVSLVLAARGLGFTDPQARDMVCRASEIYRRRVNEYAHIGQLELWYTQVSFDQLLERAPSDAIRQKMFKLSEKARQQTQGRLLTKMTKLEDGALRLRDKPPIIFQTHANLDPLESDDSWLSNDEARVMVKPMLHNYIETLKEDRQQLLDRFRLSDCVFKVVGVGSVGTRCLVMLLQDNFDQPLFLQLKEARASVLEPYTQACVHGHQGKRVVFGQRLMQAASDLFLGWATGPAGRHFYVRQLRDMKATPSLETFSTPEALAAYGQACAWTLARAHSKSGGQPAKLAGYVGNSDKFDQAIAGYGVAYADQVEADYHVFKTAIAAGRLPVHD